ncbi:MAG: phosphatase PAP2 family protein [Planctomycetes bacterium]|nr:phosphatase PAP2 family protein [Planctomycetota bacterium]
MTDAVRTSAHAAEAGPGARLSSSTRLAIVLAVGALQTLAYLLSNHHPLRAPVELPRAEFELALQFLPATVWPYLALLACELALPLLVRGRAEFRRLFVAYGIAMGVAFATYALWPTTYPRPPLPADGTLGAWAYGRLVAIDGPGCCLPSGHVIVPAIAAWSVFRDRGWWWPLALVFALVPSVLTTKQHYALDVLAGLALAAVAIGLARKLDGARGA